MQYFTVQLASNIDLTGKIFSYYAATYENRNGYNYLLLHYRSILPLSIHHLLGFVLRKNNGVILIFAQTLNR